MLVNILCFLCIQSAIGASIKKVSMEEKTIKYWKQEGHENLMKKLNEIQNKKIAKNIILFIGDGMGVSTITASRMYKNQKMVSSTLPDINLSFDLLSNVGLIKTHSVDDYITESAATATAIYTGVKVRSHVVGVGPDVFTDQCASYDPSRDNLTTIGTMFFEKRKSVGIVTNTRITHATPAAFYAHSPSRNWEYKVPANCSVDDLALQLFKKAEKFQVVLGGGSSYFIPLSMGGKREDGRDLLSEWKIKMKNVKGILVTNASEYQNIDPSNTDYLFGLLGPDHLEYDPTRGNQPSLADMTEMAIKVLSKNRNGYILLVEGGRIDQAHHESRAMLAILETLAFDKAVDIALKYINFDDTLVMVTADHSHTMTIGSYSKREVDITGKNEGMAGEELDKKGHTTLLYSNGPGFKSPRENVTNETTIDINYVYNSGVPLLAETHAGEDISVYAQGPWSHLVNGLTHQSYLAYVMMYASCTGNYVNASHCVTSGSTKNLVTTVLILFKIFLGYLYRNKL